MRLPAVACAMLSGAISATAVAEGSGLPLTLPWESAAPGGIQAAPVARTGQDATPAAAARTKAKRTGVPTPPEAGSRAALPVQRPKSPQPPMEPKALPAGGHEAAREKPGQQSRFGQAASVALEAPLPELLSKPNGGIGLPGLGVPPGTRRPPKPIVVQSAPGVTEVVAVSASMPNRISTPFEEPQVVDASGSQIQTLGGEVFILPKTDEPVGIFIADKKPGRPVVALTLVPKSIPAQSIVVQLDPSTRVADDAEEEAEGYSNRLVQLLREIVRGRVPQGYSAAPIAVGQATVGPVRATPEERWSGADMDIHRYRIENTGAEPVELTEPSFYEPGVKAVLFFPRIRIAPGETTAAYTVRGLDQEGAGPPGRK